MEQVIGKSHNLWLGGHDGFNVIDETDRPFYWLKTGRKFTFNFWSPNNPNNYNDNGEHCLHIWEKNPEYQWNDESCISKMGFICEINSYIECDSVNKFSEKIKRLQEVNMVQMTTKLQNLEQVTRDGKEETQKLKTIIDSVEQKLVDQQQLTAKNLWENLQNQGHKLNEQIAESMQKFSGNFDEKFNVK